MVNDRIVVVGSLFWGMWLTHRDKDIELAIQAWFLSSSWTPYGDHRESKH
jgi:hypothetical protein